MLASEVVIGGEVWVKVGAERAKCVVRSVYVTDDYWTKRKKTLYTVRRVGASVDLPKGRPASALHATKYGD